MGDVLADAVIYRSNICRPAIKLNVSTFICFTLLAIAAPASAFPESNEHWISDAQGCMAFNPAPDGDESIVWSGNCHNGYLDGPGVLQWHKDGVLSGVDEGTWSEGRLVGRCKINQLSGRTYVFDGECLNSSLHGFGVMCFMDHDTHYVGEWRDGQRNGIGEWTSPRGRIVGLFFKGQPNGVAEMHFPNGMRKQCILNDGHCAGVTMLLFPNGSVLETTTQDGKALGPPCRLIYGSGRYFVGRMYSPRKEWGSICTKRGAEKNRFNKMLPDLVDEVTDYASRQGFPLSGSDPFTMLAEVVAIQADVLRERGRQANQDPLQAQTRCQQLRDTHLATKNGSRPEP